MNTPLAKATLTHLATLESLEVEWNPESYSVAKLSRLSTPALPGSGASPLDLAPGGTERFRTRLLLDATEEAGPRRDLRRVLDRLESWAEPAANDSVPPPLLFVWGTFRFRGVIEELHEDHVLFDADGTPVRAWVELALRR